MMNHFQLARFITTFMLLCSCTARTHPDDALSGEAQRVKLPDLSHEPLAPAVSLTADYFRQSYPHLGVAQFQQKWQNAQKTGLLFIRSFVNTWYDEVSRVSSAGPIGPCFGDPHPENFSYLDFAGRFTYTFNDFDDSGACPVIFDALRYFTSLKLLIHDEAIEADLRRAYGRFLNGDGLPEKASEQNVPETSAIQNIMLSETTSKGKIKRKEGSSDLPPAQAQTLLALLQSASPDCKTCQLLDAVQIQTTSGGSSGLARYWVLVQAASHSPQLIEFKELTDPASQRGPWAQKQKLSRSEIIAFLWGKDVPRHFAFTRFEGKPFLMRSRLQYEAKLDLMNAEQKRAFLTEQVHQLAQLHKKTLSGSTLLEEWLGRQSEFQARRYSEARLAAQGE